MKLHVVVRTRVLGGFFILVALLLVVRLYFVQIVHGAAYKQEGTAQYIQTDPDSAGRGGIYFTTKDGGLVSAAVSLSGYSVAINPKILTNPLQVYQQLSLIVPIDQQVFMNSAVHTTSSFSEVVHHITDKQAAAVQKLNIRGIIISPDNWRAYPGGVLAAQLVGFVGYDGTSTVRVGEYGLEKQYETTLSEPTAGLFVNPFAELFANIQNIVTTDPAARRGSIITSIEPTVQAHLETVLSDVMQKYKTQFDGGIVMDPHTGEIYAIGGLPSYDPNNYGSAGESIDYQNRLVEGRYELGSIMKPLTMAAGIDSGAVTLNSTYNDTGCIMASTYKVCNFDFKARGVIPMQQILSQSLNVGASYVATQMGYPTFTKYMKLYGFGERTGIDLPNEVVGNISNLDDGQGPAVNFDTASFGQGITVSPIEMIRALAVLANDGKLPNPHLMTGVQYESGVTRTIPALAQPQVIKQSTAETVTDMLTKVFDESLLKGKLRQVHYSFAAKTGTAQIPMPGGGYYPGSTYLHSFFGYFPAHNPRFIIFLFGWKPQGQEYASATLAQPFMDMAQFLINYYDIPPDR